MPKKIEIGERVHDDKRDFTFIDMREEQRDGYIKRYYKYHCNICGYEDWKTNRLNGCRLCTNQVVVKGINDIATKAPWMVDYLENSEDAYGYTPHTNKKIRVRCPDCGKVREVSIANLYKTKKVACHCQDGSSYPNKFVYCMLKQLGVNFSTEKSFEWSDGKVYDDYIVHNGKSIIVENHGSQHYVKYQFNSTTTLESQKNNDSYKYDLALDNGIDYYVIIDCSKSNTEHIKNSIMSSELPIILGFTESDIDWIQCDKFALSNILKQVCDYKHTHPDSPTTEMAKIFKLTKECIGNYLRKGREYGWCEYNPTEEKARERARHGTCCKPIYDITTDEYFRDSVICVNYFKGKGFSMSSSNLRRVCTGQRNFCGGMKFREISHEEFNEAKRLYPDKCHGDVILLAG